MQKHVSKYGSEGGIVEWKGATGGWVPGESADKESRGLSCTATLNE